MMKKRSFAISGGNPSLKRNDVIECYIKHVKLLILRNKTTRYY